MVNCNAFQRLHPSLQSTLLEMGWGELRTIQKEAMEVILETDNDCIISAPTSGGKTEAAFLPLTSMLAEQPSTGSISVLDVSPLKALINDQCKRLKKLCRHTNVAVQAWHGDVDHHQKSAFRRNPKGILLTTPESIESMLVNHRLWLVPMFRKVQFILIDELHAFLDSQRGVHLQSLLARLFEAIGYRPRCIGLSATISDFDNARAFLNPDNPEKVHLIRDKTARRIVVGLKAISKGNSVTGGITQRLAEDLKTELGESSNLIFTNNRRTAEVVASFLRAPDGAVEELQGSFLLHHGSLSKEVRLYTESKLKSQPQINAICTSTLELGIDVGNISSIAQIDPTWSVSSLMQRLGRSGRRENKPSRLLMYVRLSSISERAPLDDHLYPSLLQGIAMIKLALAGWIEPPSEPSFHYSTEVHQILSVIKEHGGVDAVLLYNTLCRRGPFRRTSEEDLSYLLRYLYSAQLIDQEASGLLILGLEGERITSRPDFYAAFWTRFELSVRHRAQVIGYIEPSSEIQPGKVLVLNARQWVIQSVEWKTRTVRVLPTDIKKAPIFKGQGGVIHTRVYQEMRNILRQGDTPDWIDKEAVECLQIARNTANDARLDERDIIFGEAGVQWFPWVGTKALTTIALWAHANKVPVEQRRLSFFFREMTKSQFERCLELLSEHAIDPVCLAKLLTPKARQKFDAYVAPGLLDRANSIDCLDIIGVREAAIRARAQMS